MAGILFEDIFDVKDIDPDGKKFDRGVSCNNEISFSKWGSFDTRPQLYPGMLLLATSQPFLLAVASFL